MTFLDDAALAQHKVFRDRVLVATVRTAVAVSAEAPTADAAHDAMRSALATNVLNNPLGHVERFAWAVITNPSVAASGLAATDSDLEYVLTTIWDAVAGA